MLPPRSLQVGLQNGSLARLPLLLSTWGRLEAKLIPNWRQVSLSCLHVASKIATSWPTKRQSRETAVSLAILYRFPSRLGTNFMQSGGNVGRTWLELDPKLTTKAAVSRDRRSVGQFVAISEATWGQLRFSWHQLWSKSAPTCVPTGARSILYAFFNLGGATHDTTHVVFWNLVPQCHCT